MSNGELGRYGIPEDSRRETGGSFGSPRPDGPAPERTPVRRPGGGELPPAPRPPSAPRMSARSDASGPVGPDRGNPGRPNRGESGPPPQGVDPRPESGSPIPPPRNVGDLARVRGMIPGEPADVSVPPVGGEAGDTGRDIPPSFVKPDRGSESSNEGRDNNDSSGDTGYSQSESGDHGNDHNEHDQEETFVPDFSRENNPDTEAGTESGPTNVFTAGWRATARAWQTRHLPLTAKEAAIAAQRSRALDSYQQGGLLVDNKIRHGTEVAGVGALSVAIGPIGGGLVAAGAIISPYVPGLSKYVPIPRIGARDAVAIAGTGAAEAAVSIFTTIPDWMIAGGTTAAGAALVFTGGREIVIHISSNLASTKYARDGSNIERLMEDPDRYLPLLPEIQARIDQLDSQGPNRFPRISNRLPFSRDRRQARLERTRDRIVSSRERLEDHNR